MAINFLEMIGNPMARGRTSDFTPSQEGAMLGQMVNRGEQEVQQRQLMRQAGELLQSRDPAQIAQFMIQNPEMAQRVRAGMQFQSDATRQNLVEGIEGVLANPQNAEQILNNRIAMVESQGGDATQTRAALDEFKTDPEGFFKNAEVAYSIYGDPSRVQAYQKAKASGQIEQMTPYQREMTRQKDVEQDLKRQEIELKRLERQEKRETDELKKQEIKQRISDKKTSMQQAEQDKVSAANDAVASSDEGINLINQIENHPGFSSYVGAKGVSSAFGLKDQPIAGAEAAGVASLIDTLGSQQFLNAVQSMKGMGALSDAEGKKLSSAISSLDPNMSESDFKKSLATIKRFFSRAKYKAQNTIEKSKPATGGEFTSSGGVTFTVE